MRRDARRPPTGGFLFRSQAWSAPVSRSDPKHAGPFVEWQIAGDDGGAALVALAEDLEQQLGAGRRQRYITEFIDNQQRVTCQLAL